MRIKRTIFVLLSAGALWCAPFIHAQDSQSLGDAARKARQQKQQKEAGAQAAQAQDANAAAGDAAKAPKKVITNDDIPEHAGPTSASSNSQTSTISYPTSSNVEMAASAWKSQILAQKRSIASLQQQISRLSNSIHFAPGPCLSENCVQRNERQTAKETEIEALKSQLAQLQKNLEEMQEACRKQGFGNSVYDP